MQNMETQVNSNKTPCQYLCTKDCCKNITLLQAPVLAPIVYITLYRHRFVASQYKVEYIYGLLTNIVTEIYMQYWPFVFFC